MSFFKLNTSIAKLFLALFSAAGILLSFSQCSKDDSSESSDDNTTYPHVESETQTCTHQVYIALSFDSLSNTSMSYAAYYHNGLHILPTQTAGSAYANSICVVDSDVYVGGSDNLQACYWKNDKEYILPNGTSVSSIVVKGGHVYAVGYDATSTGDVARAWVDGTVLTLDGARANALAVDDSCRLYATGYEDDRTNDIQNLRFWTGTKAEGMDYYRISVSSTSNSSCGYAASLDYKHFDSDNHPFFCIGGVEYTTKGQINYQWVNRRATTLATASGNLISGNYSFNGRLYSCGNDGKVAKYWVTTIDANGNGNDLGSSSLSDGSYTSTANSIFVREGVVYVVGYEINSSGVYVPRFWNNGVSKSVYNGLQSIYVNVIPSSVYVTLTPTTTSSTTTTSTT